MSWQEPPITTATATAPDVYKRQTQTMVSATVAAGTAAGTASDTTHSFTYTVGTPIDVQAKNNATVASATLANWTMTCQ